MLRHYFQVDTSGFAQRLLYNAGGTVRSRAQDVATLAAQQRFGIRLVHSRASPVDARQLTGLIENEDAVRHGIKG